MRQPLETNSLAVAWLTQFAKNDIPIAKALLRGLRLISLSDFEAYVQRTIMAIRDENRGRLAVFPVDKNFAATTRFGSSADKISYMLTGLERLDPDRVCVRPSLESMRAERVKHIVLVDDQIGTGRRVITFWDKWAVKSVKSWLSSKFCTLHLVAFAGHENGITKILDRITYLERIRIHTDLQLSHSASFSNDMILDLCDRYGKKTLKAHAGRGYGNTMSNVVFQHGCPNNAPVCLWSHGRNWRALFPNRAIPTELFPCFGDNSVGAQNIEILWNAGQYRLALELINSIHQRSKIHSHQFMLTILGLLARRVPHNKIFQLTTLSSTQIDSMIQRLRICGLVDDSLSVTPFGSDILDRIRNARPLEPVSIRVDEQLTQFYYPIQFFGVQRKSRNEPIKKT